VVSGNGRRAAVLEASGTCPGKEGDWSVDRARLDAGSYCSNGRLANQAFSNNQIFS
jgi:hypothetical protein